MNIADTMKTKEKFKSLKENRIVLIELKPSIHIFIKFSGKQKTHTGFNHSHIMT